MRKRYLAASFMALSLAAAAVACTARPGLTGGVGWRSTPELTGPAVDAKFGEYSASSPFGGAPASEAGAAMADPAPTDEALAKAQADLASKQAEIAAKEAAAAKAVTDAKAASDAAAAASEAKPEDPALKAMADLATKSLAAITSANAKVEESAKAARDAVARADDLGKKYDALNVRATKLEEDLDKSKPGFMPKSFALQDIVLFGLAWGAWLVRKKAATLARSLADAAKTAAVKAAHEAIVLVDAMPDTTPTADVEKVLATKLPTV